MKNLNNSKSMFNVQIWNNYKAANTDTSVSSGINIDITDVLATSGNWTAYANLYD